MEQTCNLAVLAPSKEIPSSGGTAATMMASASASGSSRRAAFPLPTRRSATPLCRSSPDSRRSPAFPIHSPGIPTFCCATATPAALAKAGVSVPPGVSPYKYVGMACGGPTKSPDCPKIMAAINAAAASAVRADANGSGTFPGVPPGTYYLMISTRYNNQALVWGQAVQLQCRRKFSDARSARRNSDQLKRAPGSSPVSASVPPPVPPPPVRGCRCTPPCTASCRTPSRSSSSCTAMPSSSCLLFSAAVPTSTSSAGR